MVFSITPILLKGYDVQSIKIDQLIQYDYRDFIFWFFSLKMETRVEADL